MMRYLRLKQLPLLTILGQGRAFLAGSLVNAWKQYDEISFLRGPYNIEFFNRHDQSFRYSAAIHVAHGKQHDILQLSPLSRHATTNRESNTQFVPEVCMILIKYTKPCPIIY